MQVSGHQFPEHLQYGGPQYPVDHLTVPVLVKALDLHFSGGGSH